VTPQELLRDFESQFAKRKFVAGLLLALMDFVRELGATDGKFDSLDHLFAEFPLQETTRQGKRANTLIVEVAGEAGSKRNLSIRPFYNKHETFFQVENKRFDYPNCAPHATQAWGDYRHWLESLLALCAADLDAVEARVKQYVLDALPSHAVDPASIRPLERWFTMLLEEFDLSAHKGEPAGGAFQGIIYAYMRADAPHLHLDVARVGAGSKRLQRVGDIDGWEGERLVLSAEVKHYRVALDDVDGLMVFCGEVAKRKALGIVAAKSFEDAARPSLAEQGMRAIDIEDLLRLVDLWDPLKQRAAFEAFTYYVHHVEKKMALIKRLREFADRLRRG